MAIIGSQVAYVTLEYSLSGVNAQNVFAYAPLDDTFTFTAQEVAELFEADVMPAFEAATVAGTRFDMISVETRSPLGSTNYDLALSGSVGLVSGNALPPNAAYGFFKLPNNAAIEGTNTNHFKQGSFRLMGVAESGQSAGITESAQDLLLQDICDVIRDLVLNPLSTEDHLIMFMYREPLTVGGAPQSATFVTSVGFRNTVRHQDTRQRY